jgi:hypothetical protein
MPSPSPRCPVSAGPPSARDAAQLGRQLPQIPPLDRFVAAQGTSNAYNERRGASGIRRAFLLDVVAERDEEGQLSRGMYNLSRSLTEIMHIVLNSVLLSCDE